MISSKQSKLLEDLIMKYGQVVTAQQIFSETSDFSRHGQAEYLIASLVKQGWLMRIKKGLYAISDLSTRGFLSLSSYTVANLLVKDSYVSFESALHYYGMFDQFTSKIISISIKRYKKVQLQNIEYSYITTKDDYYFGWQVVNIDGKIARVAMAEKALIDIVNFHKSLYAIDLVVEKLRDHRNDLDLARINEYVGKFSMTTIKIFGLIFDFLKIDSSQLLKIAKEAHGAHRMIASAKVYNAKWRLYYDSYFDKYKS